MAVELIQRLISVNDYHKMIAAQIFTPADKVELLNGQIIQMSPIGSRHAACVEKIVDILKPLLANQAMVRVQNPVSLPPNSEPEPDISVVATQADYYATAHPQPKDIYILIEVADSSLEVDQSVKTGIYAAAMIPEYWIVNLEENVLEVYQKPEAGVYKQRKLYFKTDTLILSQLKGNIPVKAFFI